MKNRYQQLISGLTDKELFFHLYMTQIILLIISLVLGFILYDHFSFLRYFSLRDHRIVYMGIPLGIAVVLADILLMKILPSSYYDDGGLNERLFRNRPAIQIVQIAGIVAISEELLFRGVIQTKTGLIVASLIFALIHYRYLFNWYLFLNVVLLSFFIGFIYDWTHNLAITMVMHFTIDFLLGIYIRYRQTEVEPKESFHE